MIANAWGVCTLVAPVFLPLGASVGANSILIMAAILSGCAFGNHACFYCDTTVLASQGSGIDNFDHAVSQLPYVLIGAAVSIVGFLVLGCCVLENRNDVMDIIINSKMLLKQDYGLILKKSDKRDKRDISV